MGDEGLRRTQPTAIWLPVMYWEQMDQRAIYRCNNAIWSPRHNEVILSPVCRWGNWSTEKCRAQSNFWRSQIICLSLPMTRKIWNTTQACWALSWYRESQPWAALLFVGSRADVERLVCDACCITANLLAHPSSSGFAAALRRAASSVLSSCLWVWLRSFGKAQKVKQWKGKECFCH